MSSLAKKLKPLENQRSQGVSVKQGKKDSNPQQRFWSTFSTTARHPENKGSQGFDLKNGANWGQLERSAVDLKKCG